MKDAAARVDVTWVGRSALQVAALRQGIAEALVVGGWLGRGARVAIEPDEVLRFDRGCPGVDPYPEAGRFVFTAAPGGGAEVKMELGCRARRRLIHAKAVFWGSLAATVCTLLFGWLLHLSLPVAMVGAVALDVLAWQSFKGRLGRELDGLIAGLELCSRVIGPDRTTGPDGARRAPGASPVPE